MKRNRKYYICYSPDYKPGEGKYIKVKTKKAMWRTLYKFGAGAQADEYRIVWNSDGSYTDIPTGKFLEVTAKE